TRCDVIQPLKPITHGRFPEATNSARCLPDCALIGISAFTSPLKLPNVITGNPSDFPSADTFNPHQSPFGSITHTRFLRRNKYSTTCRNALDLPAPVFPSTTR